MTIRNKPNGLSDVWATRACQPQSVFYELEGETASLAARALDGELVHLLEAQEVHLVEPQTLIFLGETFRAAAYYPTLYRLTLPENSSRYFASVPVGYKRDYIAPAHSREIVDEQEYGHIITGLFGNGHTTPVQLDVKEPEDKEIPDDFYPEQCLFHLSIFDMRL